MSVRIWPEDDREGWEGLVRNLAAPLFHSRPWADYTVAQENVDPVCFALESGEGVALFFRQRSGNPLFRHLSQSLASHAHPWIRAGAPEAFSGFLQAIEGEAAAMGIVELTVGSFGTPGNRSELAALGYELKDRFEFFLPLDRTEDEIWAAMEYKRRKHLRNSIRKAEKMGVTIEELPVESGAAELRRLQGQTLRRIQQRGVEAGFRAEGPREDDPIGILIRAGHGRLAGARYNGEIVSAGFFTEMNGMAYYTLAGHSPEALETQASTLLLWQTILYYKARGIPRFNFGGVPFSASLPGDPEHGLYSYKEQFGGSVELCTTGSKILKPLRFRLAQQARRILARP